MGIKFWLYETVNPRNLLCNTVLINNIEFQTQNLIRWKTLCQVGSNIRGIRLDEFVRCTEDLFLILLV